MTRTSTTWLAAGTLLAAGLTPGALAAQTTPNSAENFSLLYPARAKTFVKASADPREMPLRPYFGNDDGFTGTNGCASYTVGGAKGYAALAHVKGRSGFMGLFFRNFWSGLYGLPIQEIESNRAQIEVDGQVVHELTLPDFFRSESYPSGQVAPFAGPFTASRAGGHLTHTPIVWNDEFVVRVFDNSFRNAARLHSVAGTTVGVDTPLPLPDAADWDQIAQLAGSWPHATARNPQTQAWTLAPTGGTGTLSLTGPSTILELTCTVDTPKAWNDLRARFVWDQAATPAVDVPLRFLGGRVRPPHSAPVQSLFFHSAGDLTATCYFPMHFAQDAQLEFINDGPVPVDLSVTWSLRDGPHPGDWGYFTAYFHEGVTTTGQPFLGPQINDARGMLRFIGLETTLDTSGRIPFMFNQHFEGDLCVRVDGNRGDAHTYTATETSIGKWGWYGAPVDVPFSSDGSFQTGVTVAALPGVLESNRYMGSTLVFDPINFASGFELALEHGVQNTSNAEYRLFTVFYLQPGAARTTIMELDVGNRSEEILAQVEFNSAPRYQLKSGFFRDVFFGTPPLTSYVRQVSGFYRFEVAAGTTGLDRGVCLGFRLDRGGAESFTQADVLIDGQQAGLLHAATSNQFYRWREGGDLEVELPRALTDGKTTFTVEIRPRQGGDPLRIGHIFVYRYQDE